MSGFEEFIKPSAPARLTREAFDEAIAKLFSYRPRKFQYPPIPARVYRLYAADALELGLLTEGEALTWQHMFDRDEDFRRYDRFLAYLASLGWRPSVHQ